MNTTLSQLFYRFPKLTPTQKLVLCRRRIEMALSHLPNEFLFIMIETQLAIGYVFASVAWKENYDYKDYLRYK